MSGRTEAQKARKRAYMVEYNAIRSADPVRRESARSRTAAWVAVRRQDPALAAADRTYINKYHKERRANPETWAKEKLTSLKAKARTLGLQFNLTEADLVLPAACPVLSTPLRLGAGLNHPQTPSVDRIFPALGYVRGNIRVISKRANTLKNDCIDPAELELVAAYVRKSVAEVLH